MKNDDYLELGKVDTAPLHERVYQRIRRTLMAGIYAPGQTFSLAEIAEELGTSMMPVRQAVNRLSAEGAFQVLPKRGVELTKISADKYRELVKLRMMLEGMAAEKAAEKITEPVLNSLAELIKTTEENEKNMNNWQRFNLLNHDFHFLIYTSSKLEVVPPLIEQLWLQTGPLLSIYKKVGALPNDNRHKKILYALTERNGAKAKEAVRYDILCGFRYISNAYGWSTDTAFLYDL